MRQKQKQEETIDEQTKRKMIRNYFKRPTKRAIAMIAIGVLVLLCGIVIRSAGAILLGIVLAGIGSFGVYHYRKVIPTDKQMDEWLEEDLKDLQQKALNKMGIDQSELVGDPVSVTGPRLSNTGGAGILFRRGKDNVLRFTPVDVSLLNFGQSQLLAYGCALDITTGKALNENTDEYFYNDVVSISTKTENRTVSLPKKGTLNLTDAEIFTLTTSGGTSVSVILRDPNLITKMGGGEIPTTRAEKAIQAVRKMLREKKA